MSCPNPPNDEFDNSSGAGCTCNKKIYGYTNVVNHFNIVNDTNLEDLESANTGKSAPFNDQELAVLPNLVEFTKPMMPILGDLFHKGGELKGSLTFTTSAAFNGRLSVEVNGVRLNNTVPFSANMGLNNVSFNFGNIGICDARFRIHNIGVSASSDFVAANVTAQDAAVTSITDIPGGLNITVGPTGIPNYTQYITFNVKAEAGLINGTINAGDYTGRILLINVDNNTSYADKMFGDPVGTYYSIEPGFGVNPKTAKVALRTAGGNIASNSDFNLMFSQVRDIAVNITDAELLIF